LLTVFTTTGRGLEGGVSILVVEPSLFWVRKDLISFVDLLEFLLCLWVLVKIRMILSGKTAVCLLYFLLRRVPWNTKNLVVILLWKIA